MSWINLSFVRGGKGTAMREREWRNLLGSMMVSTPW